MNHGDRLPPIALARKDPVTDLVVHLAFADALFFCPQDDARNRVLSLHAVNKTRVHHNARLNVGKRSLTRVAALHDTDNRKIKDFRKFIVALIVTGHRHNGARPISRQHIVRDKDGDFPSRPRVDTVHPQEPHPCLFFRKLRALKLRFAVGLLSVRLNLLDIVKQAFFQPFI